MKRAFYILWVFIFLAGCGTAEVQKDTLSVAPKVIETPELAREKPVQAVKPEPQDNTQKIKQLVEQLGHEEYRVREKATDKLFLLGPEALEELKRATKSEDLDIKDRAQRLVRDIVQYSEHTEETLGQAIVNGDIGAVRRLFLWHRGNIGIDSSEMKNLIELAFEYGRKDIARLLVEKGVRIDEEDGGQEWLHFAVSMGRRWMIEMLVARGADLSGSDSDGWNLLHRAASQDKIGLIQFLCKKGVPLSKVNFHGNTPLDIARQWNKHELVALLRKLGGESGADAVNLEYAVKEGNLAKVKELASKGVDLDESMRDGRSMLHFAVAQSNVVTVKFLLESGADVNQADDEDNLPLHTALGNSRLDIAKLLIEKGALLDEPGEMTLAKRGEELAPTYSLTPLHWACAMGKAEFANLLLDKGVEPDIESPNGQTPLHLAIEANQLKIAEMLIKRGADVSSRDENGWPPVFFATTEAAVELLISKGTGIKAEDWSEATMLHHVVSDNYTLWFFTDKSFTTTQRLKFAAYLIKKGLDVKAKDEDGRQPLFYASNGEFVKFLIEKGADVDARDDEGRTPAFDAAWRGMPEVLKTLADNGADMKALDKNGRSALFEVVWSDNIEVAKFLISKGVEIDHKDSAGNTALCHTLGTRNRGTALFKFLVEQGADVNTANNKGQTPLYLALEEWEWDAARHLIAKGADVNRKTKRGETLLHVAARVYCREKIIKHLIVSGCDVNAKDSEGRTPLHLSVIANEWVKSELFIRSGAKVNSRDNKGRTPLHYVDAARSPITENAKLLIYSQADPNAKDNDGMTPLDMVKTPDLKKCLRSAGAKTSEELKNEEK